MLIMTQKSSKSFLIKPDELLDPDTPIKELFRDGPIEVVVCRAVDNQISVYIQADLGFSIQSSEFAADADLDDPGLAQSS